LRINVVTINKKERDCYLDIYDHFVNMSKKFAKIDIVDIFHSKVKRAQEGGKQTAQKAYEELFSPWMQRGFTIALDPSAKEMKSENFSKLLLKKSEVTFFIGGAFGHSKEFLKKCDMVISLSQLTMSHKIAKVVLIEQIYRGLTIQFNHPYHK